MPSQGASDLASRISRCAPTCISGAGGWDKSLQVSLFAANAAAGRMPAMEPVLHITEAAKRFGATTALAGATLAVRPGEWVGLLGPNGAGKTTLIRAIAGRVRLDAGEIRLLGEQVETDRNGRAQAARHALGLVPQEIALYTTLTARENLDAFGRLHGVTGRALRERVEELLAWTGLADRADARVDGFSGGMKRRLNIACGVIHRPKIALLDEPTVGVDPQSRERIWQMLAELRQAGMALLLTTHQLDEAQQVCERIVIIDHGRVIAAGTLTELIAATVGPRRTVVLTLSKPPSTVAGGWVFDAGASALRLAVNDVAADLPPALERLRADGCQVLDVRVEAPNLHMVFLHLTGRELRE